VIDPGRNCAHLEKDPFLKVRKISDFAELWYFPIVNEKGGNTKDPGVQIPPVTVGVGTLRLSFY